MAKKFDFEYYKDKAGKWRWRLVSTTGRTMADSGQGYASKQGCLDAIDRVKDETKRANVVEVEA